MRSATKDPRFSTPRRAFPSQLFGVALFAVALLATIALGTAAVSPLHAADAVMSVKQTRDVAYVTRGDRELRADIYEPHGDGPFPAVLMIHGGAWLSGGKWQMGRHARYVAERGYTVVSIDYRLAPRDPFPAQIEDCKEAIRWMRRHASQHKIDAARIGGYGYSAGGHLAALLGVTVPEDGLEGATQGESVSTRVQAVVAGGAPCDFQEWPRESRSLAYFLGGSRAEKPDAYRKASPVTFASADDPPTLFFHGDQDALVPQRSPEQLRKQLEQVGVRSEMLVVKEAGHLATFFHDDPPKHAVEFLDTVLKPAR